MTAFTVLVLVAIFLYVVKYTYDTAKENGFENLHIDTKTVREDIELQMVSDMENLQTMASLAAKLHANGESMDVVLNAFKSIGLIEEVGILLPDGTFVTRAGKLSLSEEITYDSEVKKAPYVSGIVPDFTSKENQIVRSAVPITTSSGENVGVLYGLIDLETLESRMLGNASSETTQIFVIERGNGNFIINTINKEARNFGVFASREFVDGYNFDDFEKAALSGGNGYAAYVSKYMTDTTLYLHHAPMAVGDWQIVLAEPEKTVFNEAEEMGTTMTMLFISIVAVMIVYLILLFAGERRDSKLNYTSSKIRKLLLGINKQEKSIRNALKSIAAYSHARSAFFVASDGDDYNYINPEDRDIALADDDKAYLVSKILNKVLRNCDESGNNVCSGEIIANGALEFNSPELYKLLKKAKIKRIIFTGIMGKKKHIAVLGCLNPRKSSAVNLLLDDISVCFSMAINNKKHLNKTETVASTDSLTGLFNRMAYKTDLLKMDERQPKDFSCIYLDVNELHVVNNKYGHATGDGMLLYIANSIREVFLSSSVYRIGGDEFLIFTEDTPKNEIEDMIKILDEKIEKMNYHVSIGLDFCSKNTDTETLVGNAEKRMYEEKAKYYQSKEHKVLSKESNGAVERMSTGIREFDALLSVLSNHYQGIYCVTLETGKARKILMPSYLSAFSEENDLFEDAYKYYVNEMVHPDYQRAMLSFLNYDAIKQQLLEGKIPSIEYVRVDEKKVVLSVYGFSFKERETTETLWIFEDKN